MYQEDDNLNRERVNAYKKMSEEELDKLLADKEKTLKEEKELKQLLLMKESVLKGGK